MGTVADVAAAGGRLPAKLVATLFAPVADIVDAGAVALAVAMEELIFTM